MSTPVFRFCKRCQSESERLAGGACKACSRASGLAWRAKNLDKARERGRAWASANRDKTNAASKAWNAANKERVKEITAAWVRDNPEKVKVHRKTRYAANADKIKAAVAVWKAENRAAVAAVSAAYHIANADKLRARAAAWYEANQERAKASSIAWNKAHPEEARIYRQNRQARKRENGGVLSKGLVAKLFKLQKGKCACCREPLGDDFHLDHIMPLALGGSNTDDNIQLLRQRCNNQKHAKHPIDFMQERGFLL